MMRDLFSIKTALAAMIICGGALIAGQLAGSAERVIVMIVTGLIAFLITNDPFDPAEDKKHITAQQAEDRLSEHPQFQNFLDVSTDPIVMVENARVIAANQAARQLLGSKITGQNVRIAFRHAGAIERLSDPDAKHDGRPIQLTGIGHRDQIWEMQIRPMGSGQKLVYLANRTSAQAAEKMRVDFVANASHELMTPLAAIKGFIETLSDTEAGSTQKTRDRFLKIMADEASRMQALIRDLMSLSRIEAEKSQIGGGNVDLAHVVRDVVTPLQNDSGARGQDITVDITQPLPPVTGDAGLLRQLVSNIVANAMKYGREGTPIQLHLGPSRSPAMLMLSVSDEGDGIAPEHLPRLTERFYRVDSGRSRLVGGTGLGLSLVKHIVDGHRGHLEIKSDLGQGTKITILLPVVEV
jgi:two-component system, OmpR family, phosphate regulon sensor histidine kinase PhoR